MTDRLKGCVVLFASDMREDDAEPLIQAIAQLKNVVSVTPSLANVEDWMNRDRVRIELRERLWKTLEATDGE